MRPLIVGENNPYHTDSYFDLYPYPERSAGYRLACVVMGLYRKTYLKRFERLNLLHQLRWSVPAALQKARDVLEDLVIEPRWVILLGAKVSAAFDVDYRPVARRQGTFIVLPHPSGRNRYWNEPHGIGDVRRILTECLPEIPFGEVDGT